MKPKFNHQHFYLLLAGLSCIYFSGLNWHLAITAWLAPVFLLKYVRSVKTPGFLLFLISLMAVGAIANSGSNFTGFFPLYLISGISFGIFTSLPYLIHRILYTKNQSFIYTLLFPSVYVLIEFIATKLNGTWGSMAHTQFQVKQLAQVVSIVGLPGLSFLIVWFGSVVNWTIDNRNSQKKLTRGILIFTTTLLSVFFLGDLKISLQPKETKTVSVAAITGSINLHQIALSNFESIQAFSKGEIEKVPQDIFSTQQEVDQLILHTKIAAQHKAKILAWNECALILDHNQVTTLKDTIQKVATNYNCYVLIAFLEENISAEPKPFNNISVMVSPEGQILWEYKKSYLEPNAEALIVNAGNAQIPYIDTPYGRIGNVICYDLDIPSYIRQTGKKAIDILLVPAFDWKGITPLHPQMAGMAAIQNACAIIRPNGQGLTAIFDRRGQVLAQAETFCQNKIIYAEIPIEKGKSVYTHVGDLFSVLCLLILAGIILLRFNSTHFKQ